MAVPTQIERIDALLADQEASIREAFRDFIESVTSGPALREIIARLEARDIAGALAIVDSYVVRMGDVIPMVHATVGANAASELAALAPDLILAISFDPSNPRAAEIIRNNRFEFIRDFTNQQRKATQQALNRAYQEGIGTAGAARAFRESIGLTATQEQAVANYRNLLTNRDRRALERALRDRRYDQTVSNAIERDRPLTAAQIDRMTERYRSRYRAMRSETIARTEGVRATSQAREESMAQMIEQTGIDPRRLIRVWQPTRDNRTRDWHSSMSGQKRPYGQTFTDGLGNALLYPGDPSAPPATTINCRCALTFSVLEKA